jgi:hypothetical protein
VTMPRSRKGYEKNLRIINVFSYLAHSSLFKNRIATLINMEVPRKYRVVVLLSPNTGFILPFTT